MEKEGGFLKPKLEKKAGNLSAFPKGFSERLKAFFPHTPTEGQTGLFAEIEQWFSPGNSGRRVFILRGYAGTGKTAFLGTLVQALKQEKVKIQLMAPTGRASKVMSSFSGKTALTIHKRIFRFEPGSDGVPRLRRQKNSASDTLFVVDEASMLGNQSEYGSRGILEELMHYVFENDSNRLLIIGDAAQLPPVGTELSPALNAGWLAPAFQLQVQEMELTAVLRQDAGSGILDNATRLRECIRLGSQDFRFALQGYGDIYKMGAARLLEGIDYAYQKYGMERTLVITRTNKQANRYNQAIRNRLLFREEEVENGDWIMVVKNNYAQGGENMDFLANGELGRVGNTGAPSDDYPLRLCRMEISFPETGRNSAETFVTALDLLHSDAPQLEESKLRELQEFLLRDWAMENDKPAKKWKKLRTEPEANPLQIKFGYALTCHKAQGGQWDAVFIDHGYLREGEPDREFFRWLYTALTRARKEVFLVSPAEALIE
jgi:ATP-dependent exoDNAse (exonuclease V) alpha subunit